jgi:hypothetical protein
VWRNIIYRNPGQLGENITTTGIDLLVYPQVRSYISQRARAGGDSEHRRTSYCHGDGITESLPANRSFSEGLKERCLVRDGTNAVVARKAGIMGVVDVGGVVEAGTASSSSVRRPLSLWNA